MKKLVKKQIIKGVTVMTTLGILGSAYTFIPTAANAKTASTPVAQSIQSPDNVNDIQSNPIFRSLSEDQKAEFLEIAQELHLSLDEQNDLLKQRFDYHHRIQPQWKSSIIKAAAKMIAAKCGEKSVADITDFLFEWEDDLQTGIEKSLIKYGHFNKKVAKWTAKSIIFVLF
ncbi:hypothetical protein JOD45_003246 [Scopulibacillus daqui]|uniref:Uncharacterized protein n=1 Tax=Scopulibacillus daqui TaxID=1469162 RepID=A0ABS2Q3Y5_9BACL|nr:hypothetical protein [Scopulibacillus daqui]MBM7647011.1 hypothetical protein [Scopulibacillus daqui]